MLVLFICVWFIGKYAMQGTKGIFSRCGARGEVGADIEIHFLEVASEVEGPCDEQLRGSLISLFGVSGVYSPFPHPCRLLLELFLL
jgi:hypothetical protein